MIIMPSCSAIGCSNISRSKKLVTFPRDPVRRKLWVAKVRRKNWEPTDNSRLCEVHFKENQFEEDCVNGKKKLKPNAVPTLFDYQERKPLKLSFYRKPKSIVCKKRTDPSSSNASLMFYNRDQQSLCVPSTDSDDYLSERKLNCNEVDKNLEMFLQSNLEGSLKHQLENMQSGANETNLVGYLGNINSGCIESTNATKTPKMQSNSNKFNKNRELLGSSELNDLDSKLENVSINKVNLTGNLENMSNNSIQMTKMQIQLLKEAGATLLYDILFKPSVNNIQK